MTVFNQKISRLTLIFWCFAFVYVFDYHFDGHLYLPAFGYALIEVISYAITVYINYYLFVPMFLGKNRRLEYAGALLLYLIVYLLFIYYSGLMEELYEHDIIRNIISTALNIGMFIFISNLYWYNTQFFIKSEKLIMVEQEKKKLELDLLRNHISPHFFFNNMNIIYAMAIQKHSNTAPMIAKLSSILRYFVYDTISSKVMLSQELDAIKNYIELQLYRNPDSRPIDVNLQYSEKTWYILPTILIGFIENAFKHSNFIENPDAWIKAQCTIDDNGLLIYNISNSIDPLIMKNGGQGMLQIHRQLELHYEGIHKLEIEHTTSIYSIVLHLCLSAVDK